MPSSLPKRNPPPEWMQSLPTIHVRVSPAYSTPTLMHAVAAVDQADVKLIKSVPCAILVGTQDDLLSVDTLAEVSPRSMTRLHPSKADNGHSLSRS